MKKVFLGSLLALAMGGSLSHAALVTTHYDIDGNNVTGPNVDGVISANEYGTGNSYAYTGGGDGFGGTLGNATIYMQSSTSNLYVGANIAGNLGSNIIAVFLDTKAGGFTNDSTLGDTADGGRAVASKLTRDVQDNLPIDADYVLEFGNGFTNLFELKTGSLNYIGTPAAGSGGSGAAGSREASIALATLGITAGYTNVDFFAVLISDTQFASGEGIPNQGFGSYNPGFNNGNNAVTWANFDRFAAVPEPASAGLMVLGGLAVLARRHGRKA